MEGARRRDYGDEAQTPQTEDQKEELRKDAFRKLEKTIADEEVKRGAGERIDRLLDVVDRNTWDPYERNQALRKVFRVGRKEREAQAERDEDLRERLGTGVELLPESEEDRLRAGIVDFEGLIEEDALSRPLFKEKASEAKTETDGEGLLKKDKELKRNKEGFVASVVGNTRMIKDPFLNGGKTNGKTAARLPGVKRKRVIKAEPEDEEGEEVAEVKPSLGLVDYDSD